MISQLWAKAVTGLRQSRSGCSRLVLVGASVLFVSFFNTTAFAETSAKAVVIYPSLRPPYARVFDDILEGITQSFEGELTLVAVSDNLSRLPMAEEQQPDVVIALGNNGYEVARGSLAQGVPLVLAGVSSTEAASHPGVSVLPDPRVVFVNLQMLAPAVNHLHILIREEEQELYSRWIEEAAGQEQIRVTLHRCVNFHSCAEAVRYITTLDLGRSDGLWLADPGAVDNAILGIILENAWNRRFAVISSNPSHVRRGVLFALYPNNLRMGETLGNIANRVVAGEQGSEGIEPLRDVHLAVNLRTGSRIGLVFDRDVRGRIDLAFPVD